MITSPRLVTTLLYDVSRRWSLYLNRCMTTSSSEDVGVPGAIVPFSVEPMLLELESWRYVGTLLPSTLTEMVSVQHSSGGGSGMAAAAV